MPFVIPGEQSYSRLDAGNLIRTEGRKNEQQYGERAAAPANTRAGDGGGPTSSLHVAWLFAEHRRPLVPRIPLTRGVEADVE